MMRAFLTKKDIMGAMTSAVCQWVGVPMGRRKSDLIGSRFRNEDVLYANQKEARWLEFRSLKIVF
jgi:hypothetical protein